MCWKEDLLAGTYSYSYSATALVGLWSPPPYASRWLCLLPLSSNSLSPASWWHPLHLPIAFWVSQLFVFCQVCLSEFFLLSSLHSFSLHVPSIPSICIFRAFKAPGQRPLKTFRVANLRTTFRFSFLSHHPIRSIQFCIVLVVVTIEFSRMG